MIKEKLGTVAFGSALNEEAPRLTRKSVAFGLALNEVTRWLRWAGLSNVLYRPLTIER